MLFRSDWFSLDLQSGDRVQVVADTDPLGSFDLTVLSPLGQVLAQAPTALLATAGSTGKHFLRARTNDASAVYALRIQTRAGVACDHSPVEAHPQASQALRLPVGRSLDFAVCPGEETWFVVRTPGGVAIDGTLVPSAGGALVFELYDSNANTFLARDETGSAAPHVEAQASQGGQFFLRVRGAQATATNRYDLTVHLLGALP